MTLDMGHLRQWIGRGQESAELLTPRVANSLSAVLNGPVDLKDGDTAPIGIHWCLAPDIVPMNMIGQDGHPLRGDFLPPVPLPRRMWAGGHLEFFGEISVGQTVLRRSRIGDVTAKEGASGSLCFVAVMHDYIVEGRTMLRERHDIVYRGAAAGQASAGAEASAKVVADRFEVEASEPLLQRYSAAMLNGHRIHYDRDYCVNVEGYPALVVHGPLQATFLLMMALRLSGGRYPQQFGYRASRPLFDGGRFSVNGATTDGKADLWIADAAGATTLTAQAQWGED